MRRSMKVWEFAAYLEKNQFQRISYESCMQPWYDPAHTLYLHLYFDAVHIRENPNGLFFYRNGKFIMALPHVRRVFLDDSSDPQNPTVTVASDAYPGADAKDVLLVFHRR